MIELSVVIPSYDRGPALRRCLDALAAQELAPTRYEVIVVDDGSAQDVAAVLAGYDPPYALRIERQENQGQAAALNRGIALAGAPVCVILDDDLVAEPGLLSAHLAAQQQKRTLAIGWIGLELERRGSLARTFAAWWADHYARLESGARTVDYSVCYSGNLSAPTEELRAAGGFDATLRRSFDVELAYRLVGRGLRPAYLPGARATQRYDKGFRGILGDFERAGAASIALWRRHPALLRTRPLGDFAHGTRKALLLRKLLLAAPLPLAPFALLDRALDRRPSRRLFHLCEALWFWRGVRAALRDEPDTWRRLTRGPVILMYHAVAGEGERPSRYVIPARRLRAQLRWLRRRGYRVVALDDVVDAYARGELPPAKAVVLTFDDGYADVAERALPLLEAADAPATLYLVTSALGTRMAWDPQGTLAGRRLLDTAAIRALGQHPGVTLGAHTTTHPRLTELDAVAAEEEIAGSKRALEALLARPTRHFSYPYGKRSAPVEALVRDAGFASAVGIQPGANGPAVSPHDLRRLEVTGRVSILRFALELWLGLPLRPPRGS